MPYSDHTARRVVTTHNADDSNGDKATWIDETLDLPPLLNGAAYRTQIFSHHVPAISAHHITPADVQEANALTKHVTLKDGVSSCVMDMPPGAKINMHRTESVDHGVILHGSVWLTTPRGKAESQRVLLKEGDVFVQRGTSHTWEAGPEGVRFFVVMADAKPVVVNTKPLEEFWT